jgi:ribosomal protein S27AE
MPLPQYDPGASCPKCGGLFVATRYCDSHEAWAQRVLGCPPKGEHLHRRCERCGYSYVEATINHDKTGEAERGGVA